MEKTRKIIIFRREGHKDDTWEINEDKKLKFEGMKEVDINKLSSGNTPIVFKKED